MGGSVSTQKQRTGTRVTASKSAVARCKALATTAGEPGAQHGGLETRHWAVLGRGGPAPGRGWRQA